MAEIRPPTTMKAAEAGNVAIIVDPSSMQIIAKATDQTHKHDMPVEGSTFSEAKADVTCSLDESTDNDSNLLLPGSFLPKCNSLNMEISCINPWGWMNKRTCEQKSLPCDGCYARHPLRHAPMVAIENAVERDRTMFPSLTSITKPVSNGNMENYSDNEPAKRLKTATKDNEQLAYESFCCDLSETSRPYLCTGFYIFLVWEPCTMCVMALVHHRFKHVFYAFPNPVTWWSLQVAWGEKSKSSLQCIQGFSTRGIPEWFELLFEGMLIQHPVPFYLENEFLIRNMGCHVFIQGLQIRREHVFLYH